MGNSIGIGVKEGYEKVRDEHYFTDEINSTTPLLSTKTPTTAASIRIQDYNDEKLHENGICPVHCSSLCKPNNSPHNPLFRYVKQEENSRDSHLFTCGTKSNGCVNICMFVYMFVFE
jgi:hypothetical protein